MAYKIAIASSNGIKVDLSFGAADAFDIYEVDGTEFHLFEKRTVLSENACNSTVCGGCGTGGGCGKSGEAFPKVDLIRDCRCIVCKKIGFQVQKQLEKHAIIGFDVECPVDEALKKITGYLNKVDAHQSLRGLAKENT